MVRMLDPNLKYPVIGDTDYKDGLKPIHAEMLCTHYGHRYAGLLEKALAAANPEAGDEYTLAPKSRAARGRCDIAARRTEFFPAWQVGVLRNGDPDGHTTFYFNANAAGGHRHTDTLGIGYVAHDRELVADRGYMGRSTQRLDKEHTITNLARSAVKNKTTPNAMRVCSLVVGRA